MTGFNTDGIHLRKNGGVISIPPTDKIIVYVDASGDLKAKDDTGAVSSIGIDLTNEVAVVSGGVDTNAAAIIVNASDISNLTSDVAVVSGGVVINAAAISAIQGDYVSLTTNQTISGDKEFANAVIGVDPTLDQHLATKIYVDTAVVSAGGGATDHGALTGLADDDHTQYILVDGSRNFTGTVGGVTPAISSDLATKDYVDSSLILIDHGGLDGLGDDDHTQYLRHDGTRQISSTIITDTSGAYNLGSLARPFKEIYTSDAYYIGSDTLTTSAGTLLVNGSPVQGGGGGVTDHGALTGLADDDHAQYFLADGSREVSGSVIPSTSGTLDLGSASQPFRDLYVTENSLHLGPNTISTSAGTLLFNGAELTVNSASQVVATVTVREGETISAGMGVSVDPTSAGTAVEGQENILTRETTTAHTGRASYRDLLYHPDNFTIEFEGDTEKAWIFYYNGATFTRVDTGVFTHTPMAHKAAFSATISEDGSQVAVGYMVLNGSDNEVYLRIGSVNSSLKTITWDSQIFIEVATSTAATMSPALDIFPDTNYGLFTYGKDEGSTISFNAFVFDITDGTKGTTLTSNDGDTSQQPRFTGAVGLTATKAFGYMYARLASNINHYYSLTRSGLSLSKTGSFADNTDLTNNPFAVDRIQFAPVGSSTVVMGGVDNFETVEGYKYCLLTVTSSVSVGAVQDFYENTIVSSTASFYLNKRFGDRSSTKFVLPILDGSTSSKTPYIIESSLSNGSLVIDNQIAVEDPVVNTSTEFGFNCIEIDEGVFVNVWDDSGSTSKYNALTTTGTTTWLGLSLENKTGGEQLQVLLKGIYETTGLQIVEQYYFDINGNLTTNNSSQPVGNSIDSETLFIDMLGGYETLAATFNPENNILVTGHLNDSTIHFSLDTSTDLGTSDSVAPSQNAVKSYVDAATSGGGVTDHGALTGLADDDHTQYLLTDGSREITGSLVPSTSGTLSLGTSGQPFKDLYVLENSVFLGTNKLSVSGGNLQLNDSNVGGGAASPPTENKTTSFTAQVGFRYYLNGSTNFTATLPTAVGNFEEEIEFITFVGNTAVCTIDPNGSQTIQGGDTYDMTYGDRIIIFSDGANWIIKEKVGTVNFYADSNAGQSLSVSTTLIQYEDNISDPYGAWSGNNTFTAPRSGYYNVNATIGTESSVASYSLEIYINGSFEVWGPVSDNSSFSRVISIDKTVFLNAGDTLTLRAGMTVTRDTSTQFNKLYITEVS